jgi:hypothetical protein
MRWAFAATLSVLFVLGWMLAGWCGLQQDEALFLKAIDDPAHCAFSIRKGRIALMIMPYVGALKAALFVPYLKLVPASVFTLRLPLVLLVPLLAGLSLWFWSRLAPTAAVILTAALLLAHPHFTAPVVLDWGPVGLQLLFTLLAMHAYRKGAYAAVGLLAGLMVWDKAVAVWVLAAVASSAALYYPSRLRPMLQWRVPAAFLLGASPYVYYRIIWPDAMEGFRTGIDFEGLTPKLDSLWGTFDGTAIAAYVFPVPVTPQPPGLPVLFALLAVLGFAVRRRLPAFFWTATLAALAAMLVTGGAGGSVHHHVLAWPLLGAAVCTTLAAVPVPRWPLLAAAAVVCVLQVHAWSYYWQGAELGTRREWTDATTPVAEYLAQPGVCPGGVYALDWGFSENVTALGRGRFVVSMVADQWWQPEIPREPAAIAAQRAAAPGACLLEWADGAAPFFPGIRAAAGPALATRSSRVFLNRRQQPVIRLYETPPPPESAPPATPARPASY